MKDKRKHCNTLGHLGCCLHPSIALSKQMEQVRAVPTDRKPMLSSGGKVSFYPVPAALPLFSREVLVSYLANLWPNILQISVRGDGTGAHPELACRSACLFVFVFLLLMSTGRTVPMLLPSVLFAISSARGHSLFLEDSCSSRSRRSTSITMQKKDLV